MKTAFPGTYRKLSLVCCRTETKEGFSFTDDRHSTSGTMADTAYRIGIGPPKNGSKAPHPDVGEPDSAELRGLDRLAEDHSSRSTETPARHFAVEESNPDPVDNEQTKVAGK